MPSLIQQTNTKYWRHRGPHVESKAGVGGVQEKRDLLGILLPNWHCNHHSQENTIIISIILGGNWASESSFNWLANY